MAKLNATDLGYTTLADIRDNHFFALSDNNDKSHCSFDVPPFQRGYVWLPHQAELLWDSLARGLPIGTLVASETPQKGRFHLVDGRQRVTSIRLGFHDPFRTSEKHENESTPPDPLSTHSQMLWIDIGYSPTTERMFLFRVTTLFHPWGFPASTSSRRLETYKMRAAYLAYKHIYNHTPENGRTWRNNTDLLTRILPWDSSAPLPLSWLLDELLAGSQPATITSNLCDKIKEYFAPAFHTTTPSDSDTSQAVDAYKGKINRTISLLEAAKRQSAPSQNIETFISALEGLRRALRAKIPVTILVPSYHDTLPYDTTDDTASSDPELLLFERINRGGTILSADDLALSVLKSHLRCPFGGETPEALRDIETIRPLPTPPPHLAAALIRATRRESGRRYLLDRIRLRQLKNWILKSTGTDEGDDPIQDLCKILQRKHHLEELLNAVSVLLTGPKKDSAPSSSDAALPPVLAFDLCNSRRRDLLALILFWLLGPADSTIAPESSLKKAEKAWVESGGRRARRIIGCVTLLAWLRWDEKLYRRAVRQIAEFLATRRDISLDKAFVEVLTTLDKEEHLFTVPAAKPRSVDCIFQAISENAASKGGALLYFDDIKDVVSIDKSIGPGLFTLGTGGNPSPDELRVAWNNFVHSFIMKWSGGWRLVCYGQRALLRAAYAWYDASDPDAVRDHSVPWDYDHIVPNSWFYNIKRKKIPNFVKTWGQSIGNYRLWPAELNRSKRDDLIFDIADGKVGQNTASWFIENLASQAADISVDQLLQWSGVFLRDDERWRKLRNLWLGLQDRIAGPDPEREDRPRDVAIRALANDAEAQKAFMEAVTARAAALYAEWYEQLCIGEILGEAAGNR